MYIVHPYLRFSFVVCLASLASLAACDSLPEPDRGDTCASIGVTEIGSVTATTPAGAFRTTCVTVAADGGLVVAVARETGSGATGGATLELYIGGTETGTYVFEQTESPERLTDQTRRRPRRPGRGRSP